MKKKIALSYSGGLDTTVIVPWLKENYDCEVIAVCGDVGQECDWASLEKKAIASGAAKLIIKDLKKEFVEDYLWPLVKSGSYYEGRYLLRNLCRAAPHSEEPDRDGSCRGLLRHRPRLYGQRQRSGALRAGHQGLRPRDGGDRALADLGHLEP